MLRTLLNEKPTLGPTWPPKPRGAPSTQELVLSSRRHHLESAEEIRLEKTSLKEIPRYQSLPIGNPTGNLFRSLSIQKAMEFGPVWSVGSEKGRAFTKMLAMLGRVKVGFPTNLQDSEVTTVRMRRVSENQAIESPIDQLCVRRLQGRYHIDGHIVEEPWRSFRQHVWTNARIRNAPPMLTCMSRM